MPNKANLPSPQSEVVIIGAGPVGLFAIFACGMLGMRCQVIDGQSQLGGQCTALYPDKPIYDIPGYPTISAGNLIKQLTVQAQPFVPIYHLGHQAHTLKQMTDGRWTLTTKQGLTLHTKAVIIAGGGGDFVPNRPPLANIEAYEGRSIFYLVSQLEDYAGLQVVIAGGGDSAVDWALSLAQVAKRVMIVHRRAEFRAAPANIAQLNQQAANGQIELVTPYQVGALEGLNSQLKRVGVVRLGGTDTRWLTADRLLLFFGLRMNLGAIADWGLNLAGQRIVINPQTSATNLPGIFAVGDITTYPGKLKLILTGFAEATHAAHNIHPLLFPGQALHFEHSTTKGIPRSPA